ncbi:hypothetical protein PF005_g2429 [Phytophthora fragariae]|uniref:Uncharacterized protein n=1 Tax=Phytophthora fragariae TaxID=53985 RepID=A0A6A3FLI9_9STRA|nr:hypothetical protein PF003_g8521 [Phytophthora fragariae]KAE8946062.1 hypothetical protein PF009_g4289 [Phytophthora fragariae]KAE9025130.1 hypothetical protein PF011_g3195 [Phytophthora fragariae]KAE9135581.1 hypothetical protein PF010_g2010 [Phytophthora fragariae]KAE9135929.1 hypothetical protein PF007_g2374 [Phytophthora fragariae]
MQLGNILATCSLVCVFGGQVLQVTSSLGRLAVAKRRLVLHNLCTLRFKLVVSARTCLLASTCIHV